MTDRLKKAGRLQMLTIAAFLVAAGFATFAVISGRYPTAAIHAALMAVLFYLYQVQSSIIRTILDSDQRHLRGS